MVVIELPLVNNQNSWGIYNYMTDTFDGKPCLRVAFGYTAYDICIITKDIIFEYNGIKYSKWYYYEEYTQESVFWFSEYKG